MSDCTWLEKNGSFVSQQQRDILPCTLFIFHLIHPLHIILVIPLSFFFFFSFSFFSFPYTYFFFTFLSLDIFIYLSKLSTHLFLA
jgi:hypothetical protein